MDNEKKETEHAKLPENTHMTHVEHHNKKNITEKLRQNPWILSTFVFGVIILILLLGGFNLTGKAVSETQAGNTVVNFLNDYLTNGGISLNSVEKNADLGVYKVKVNYQDNTLPMSLSLDGKYIDWGLGMVNMNNYIKYVKTQAPSQTQTQTPTQTAVPKTDKPSVELYVFAYCPYGLQMEKAMIPVVKLLGSKIDFKIRQIGAMHGDYEKVEAQRQLCIEKNYPSKFLDYVLAFAQDTSCPSGDSACVTTKVNSLFSKLGIDASKINSCMTSEGQKLYDAEVANANSKGVGGSPTLKINNADSQASRSPDGVLTAVCSAFNTSPSECSQKLSTDQASAGFGTGSSSGAAASCH